MRVYVLSFVPYGCPAHDTEILGVYKTFEVADKVRNDYINDEYDGDELIIEDYAVTE